MASWLNLGKSIADAFRRGLDEILGFIGYASAPVGDTQADIARRVPDASPADIKAADDLMREAATAGDHATLSHKARLDGQPAEPYDLNSAPENPLAFEVATEGDRYKAGLTFGIYDSWGNKLSEWSSWTYFGADIDTDSAIEEAGKLAIRDVEKSPGRFNSTDMGFNVKLEHISLIWKRF